MRPVWYDYPGPGTLKILGLQFNQQSDVYFQYHSLGISPTINLSD